MKKLGVILVTSLLILNLLALALTLAQEETPPGLNPEKIEETKEQVEGKWDYLSKEWKTILLKNKFILAADNLLKKINIVFVILFGQPYSLSLTLFLTIIFWFILIIFLQKALSNFSLFSEGTSVVISLSLAVAFAQLQVFKKISEFLIWLILKDKPWWLSIMITILLIIIFVIIFKIYLAYLENIKKQREEGEKEQEEIDRKLLHIIVERFKDIFGKE